MALLNIKSENKDLSYIIQKNPNTGMIMKSFRKGVIYGYYGEDGSYYSYFKDGDDEISLSNEKDSDGMFEYNDTSRYNSPNAVLGIIKTLFKTALNTDSEYDSVGKEHVITVNQMFVYNTKYFDILNRYFGEDYKVELTEVSSRNFKIVLRTSKTLREALAYLFTLCTLYYFRTNEPYLVEEEILMYAKVLKSVNAPYFIKYVFKSNLPYSVKKFQAIKELLDENDKGEVWDIKVGNTHTQRMDFILNQIEGNNPIIDLGCGDMSSYGFRLAKLIDKADQKYYAIDNDKDITDNLKGKIEGRGLENILVLDDFNSFADADIEGKFDIIMSEIFEHVELAQDTKWIKKIIEKITFNKIIITTPNKSFNTNYLFEGDEEMRLESHVFEMSTQEFQAYFNKLLGQWSTKINWEFIGIGDCINGEYVTQSVIITNK